MKINKTNYSNNNIIISIIIPVYNRAQKIDYSLEKMLDTDYPLDKIELILVDDYSSDNSYEEILKFKDRFPNFTLIQLESNSGGASKPRNVGLQHAIGEWILFIDSDDYITPYTLSDAMKIADKDNTVELICLPYFRAEGSTRSISRSAFHYTETQIGLNFIDTKLYNSLNIIGKLIRKEIIEEYKINFPEDIRVREDNWFTMKVYSVVNNIAILGNKKNYYFYDQQDEVALSNNGAPPRDAVKIYLSVYYFIQSLDLPTEDKLNLLSIFLNRYTNL
ncbi:glycosyl transferase, partial [Staphylococcus rostri]